jgi:hypothetical protein
MKNAPVGWHLMLGIGLLMSVIFAFLYFGPSRCLQRQLTAAANWPEAGRQMARIHPMVLANFTSWGGLADCRDLFCAVTRRWRLRP